MAINLSDLPPKYQEQALHKYQEQERRRTNETKVDCPPSPAANKYKNQKDERAGIRFDSRKEARRYDELMLLAAAGQIKDLRLQVDFTLQEAYTTEEGERIRAIRYRADFTYMRRVTPPEDGAISWERVVEDVKSKGTRTSDYIMKRKLLRDKLGITIQEV